jgi:hypothetical protein
MRKNKWIRTALLLASSLSIQGFCGSLDERTGIWEGNDVAVAHMFDLPMANALGDFFISENATSVVDLGCGLGNYTQVLREHGLYSEGYDGNPNTPELTNYTCGVQALHVPFYLGKEFSWVLSLEVGEHIPAEFETILIENLVKHAIDGIVLSWAVEGQGGWGHFNCRNNDYVRKRMESYGFVSDEEAEQRIRSTATSCGHFRTTLMVFRRAH